ncbi:MAG: LysM peptidoglycan-binding domain-containing protein [Raineya sp.]|jgi:LysM repeat protein|nr:LysM peptidoglycan-binding domain-containing protein [Raineya sp.]
MKISGKILLSSFVLFLFAHALVARPTDSLRLEIDKNKKKAWIIHKVDAKETLFGLARRYKVTVDDITKENPQAKNLRINDLLRIPYKDFEKQATLTSPQETNKTKTAKHTVAAGETLYKISQKYKVSVADLQKWNTIGAAGIKTGQELWITKPTEETKETKEVKENKENKENKETKEVKVAEKTIHVVKEDESPYTISKKYNVKLTEFLEWNGLVQDSRLQIGQKLEVYPTGYKKTIEPAENKENKEVKENKENKETKEVKETKETTEGSEITRQVITISGYSKIIEKGTAEVMEDDKAGNYTGLHKDAPIGTIVAVKNEASGESVFVRIIGKLPSVGNGKTLIKVSKNVYEALGAKTPKFNVEVSYIP